MDGSFGSSIDGSCLAHISLDMEENTNNLVSSSINTAKPTQSLHLNAKRVKMANNGSIVCDHFTRVVPINPTDPNA